MSLPFLVLVAASYLIGAIPFGLLVSRASGIDIRRQGSGNIGATNVTRLLGKKLGVITLLADAAKGYFPVFLASKLSGGDGLTIACCGAAAVAGHMFPLYLGFHGGKGVATALGVFLFLSPAAVLGCLAVFLLTVRLSGYVSLGSLLGSVTMLPLLYFLSPERWKLLLACCVVALIWARHYQNIGRLLRGEEKPWKNKVA